MGERRKRVTMRNRQHQEERAVGSPAMSDAAAIAAMFITGLRSA